MTLQPGQMFAERYRIVRMLGEGAMGAVYEGYDVRIQRRLAIKVLHPAMALQRETVQRFEREAQAAGRIGSQHIVEVIDVGAVVDGTHYLIMEYLEGTTLEERLRERGRLAPVEAAPIVHELLAGLSAAHAAGIIHRDLKPANVFLLSPRAGRVDFVKILDFGVSRFSALAADASMTSTGTVLGTPYYMSPEQAKGAREIDLRSDLYAVGVILYECITGQVPFHAETFNELIFKIVLEAPPPAETFLPEIDSVFAAIVRRAMSRDVADRFQSATDFQRALGEWMARTSSRIAAVGTDRTGRLELVRPWSDDMQAAVTLPFAVAPVLGAAPATRPVAVAPVQGRAPASNVGPSGTVMIDPPRSTLGSSVTNESVDIPMRRASLVPVVVFGSALLCGGVVAAVLLQRASSRQAAPPEPASVTEEPVVAASSAALPQRTAGAPEASAPSEASAAAEPPAVASASAPRPVRAPVAPARSGGSARAVVDPPASPRSRAAPRRVGESPTSYSSRQIGG